MKITTLTIFIQKYSRGETSESPYTLAITLRLYILESVSARIFIKRPKIIEEFGR